MQAPRALPASGCEFPMAVVSSFQVVDFMLFPGGPVRPEPMNPRNFGPIRRVLPESGEDSRFVPGDCWSAPKAKIPAPGTGAGEGGARMEAMPNSALCSQLPAPEGVRR